MNLEQLILYMRRAYSIGHVWDSIKKKIELTENKLNNFLLIIYHGKANVPMAVSNILLNVSLEFYWSESV